MAAGRFVAYYRVSTQRQGQSGLGLEAQRTAVLAYLNGGSAELVAEHVEVESGKRDDNRPELAKAFAACRLHGAKLVIAKLDRLSRDAHFLLGLQKASVPFVAADMPDANELTVGLLAVIAQHERKIISERTKAALAAARARGVKLGTIANLRQGGGSTVRANQARRERARQRAADLAPTIEAIRATGATSFRAIAVALNARGIPTPRGGVWHPGTVVQILRLG